MSMYILFFFFFLSFSSFFLGEHIITALRWSFSPGFYFFFLVGLNLDVVSWSMRRSDVS